MDMFEWFVFWMVRLAIQAIHPSTLISRSLRSRKIKFSPLAVRGDFIPTRSSTYSCYKLKPTDKNEQR